MYKTKTNRFLPLPFNPPACVGFPSHHMWDSWVSFAALSAGWASGAVTTPAPGADAESSVATELNTSLAGLGSTPHMLILQAS